MIFVCWLWRGRGFWKPVARYDERHVDTLSRMLARHGGHELICVQDGTFEPACRSIFMPPSVAALPDYLPKLWAWSEELHDLIGQRFASIDLDVVVSGDLAPLLDTADPLVIWDHAFMEPYNTSLFALEPGFGTQVWERLSPEELAAARDVATYWTGDQSWVAHVLGPGQATFGEHEGVIQYRPRIHRDAHGSVPEHTRMAALCGPYEPISERTHSAWVRAHYA